MTNLPRVKLEDRKIPDDIVVLSMSKEQAQAVLDKLYVYDTSDGWLERARVVQALKASGFSPSRY